MDDYHRSGVLCGVLGSYMHSVINNVPIRIGKEDSQDAFIEYSIGVRKSPLIFRDAK